MNQNLVELVCVIDRSGSMAGLRNDAIGGFNTFLEEQKKAPGETRLTLVLFNDKYNRIYDGISISEAKPLTIETYVPAGSTALLDALGKTITDIGVRLSNTPENERPGKVIFAILTDGEENASAEYARDVIFEKIKHQTEVYSWGFLFLAANQDAIAAADSIGVMRGNSYNIANTAKGMDDACYAMSRSANYLRSEKSAVALSAEVQKDLTDMLNAMPTVTPPVMVSGNAWDSGYIQEPTAAQAHRDTLLRLQEEMLKKHAKAKTRSKSV